MTHDAKVQELFHAARSLHGASAATLFVAIVAFMSLDGAGKIAVPVALLLISLILWLRGRPRQLDLDEEISRSVDAWMEGKPGETPLRETFRLFLDGVKLAEAGDTEGLTRVRDAVEAFDQYLSERDGKSSSNDEQTQGLVASATLHRARGQYLLLSSSDEKTDSGDYLKVLDSLAGFEERFAEWRILVLPALALRIRLHAETGSFEAAEADQALLDARLDGAVTEPLILDARLELADHIWRSAEASGDVSDFERALLHYEAWLRQSDHAGLAGRVHVAGRADSMELSERVIQLLGSTMEEGAKESNSKRRDLLDANRLLARAYLRLEDPVRALRSYSVLMSVAGEDNIYLRDPDVLHEVKEAEAAVANGSYEDQKE